MARLTWRIWVLIIMLFLALLMISPTLSKGIVIKSIDRESIPYEQGLRTGMIIKEINSQKIATMEDYANALLSINSASANETRIEIITDKDSFVFLAQNLSGITVQDIPKTKIKTGLDLSGGARAIIRPANVTVSAAELQDLVDITSQRLNAFGLSDVTVRSAKDLSGNNFMIVEIAGATPADIKNLLGSQGKFEAKIANQTVFIGGEKDISDVCKNDASCAAVQSCSQVQGGYACNFVFNVYLKEAAAKRQADATRNLSLDETGKYLKERIYLYLDDKEVDSLLISSRLRGQTTTQISIEGSGTGATRDEAIQAAQKEMAHLQTVLLTGSLPYKLEIVKLDTISPYLGQEFTRSLLLLGAAVFIIVSIALFIKYRKIKITSAVILTMFSEAFITLGIAALIRWNLDAPSIAGIIAGMGTGVNDQIVIIDEAVSGGETESESMKARIKRALFIIVGAFLTIIAAMLPLFWAGAGMLKGFALTTIIGVSVGILITRPAFADIVKKLLE
jgi:preprotein translocase subunit SecD